jgi:hypothetical protein
MTDAQPDRGLERGLAWAGLGLAAAVGLLRLQAWTCVNIQWSDRDLWRADRFFVDWPTTGAELSYGAGARVPGGGWYALLAALRATGADAAEVYRQLLLLDLLGAAVLAAAVWRGFGPVAAAVTALLYVSPAEVRAAMNAVWNPTLLPATLALAHALLAHALRTGSWRAWAGWSLTLSFAAQLHMTGLAWFGWSLVGLAWIAPRDLWRAAPALLAGVGLAWAPHLLDEALHGWPNTTAMWVQTPVREAWSAPAVAEAWTEVVAALAVFRPTVPALADLPISLLVAWLVALGAIAACRRDGDRFARALVLPAVALSLTPAASVALAFEDRYVLAALPAWAVLAGYGARQLDRGAVAGLAIAAVSPAVALAAMSSGWWHGVDPGDQVGSWTERKLADVLGALRSPERPTLADVVGRAAFLEDSPDGPRLLQGRSVEVLLTAAGQAFPGSLPPPCLLLVDGDPPDAATLAAAVGLGEVHVLDVTPIPWGTNSRVQAITWRPLTSDLCPSSLSTRYIDTPIEQRLRAAWPLADSPATLAGEPPLLAAQWQASPRRHLPALWVVGADLTPGPGRLTGQVHVPQLRGQSFNDGWYTASMADHLRLQLTRGDEVIDVALASVAVGVTGVVSPFRVDAAVPSGTWAVALVARPWFDPGVAPDWRNWEPANAEVRVPLSAEIVVP